MHRVLFICCFCCCKFLFVVTSLVCHFHVNKSISIGCVIGFNRSIGCWGTLFELVRHFSMRRQIKWQLLATYYYKQLLVTSMSVKFGRYVLASSWIGEAGAESVLLCWHSRWRRKSTLRWNARSQSPHLKGLYPECLRMWVIKFELWLNDFKHTTHLCGFSPVKKKEEKTKH